jgi:hypothetical protein
MNRIQMPVDLRTVIYVPIPEKIESMPADLFSLMDDLVNDIGKVPAQEVENRRNVRLFKEKAAALLLR